MSQDTLPESTDALPADIAELRAELVRERNAVKVMAGENERLRRELGELHASIQAAVPMAPATR